MCTESEIVRLTKNTRFFIGAEGLSDLTIMSTLKSISIWDINWRIRFFHALKNINKSVVIENLEQLLDTHYEDFLNLRDCGITTIEQARKTIINFLLSFNNIPKFEVNEELLKEKNEKRIFIESYPFLDRLNVSLESLKIYLNIPLQEFEFPLRFNQFILRINERATLRELLLIDPDILIKEKNIGRKTITDVSKIIDEKITRLERGLEKIGEKNIIVIINKVLGKISERELTILTMRWSSNNLTSLEEIGSRYDLTRERIRQIIQRVINKAWTQLESEAEYYRKIFLDYLINEPAPIKEQILFNSGHDLLYPPRLYLGLLAEIFQEAPFQGFMPIAFDQLVNREIAKDSSWKYVFQILEKLKIGHNEISTQKLKETLETEKLSNSQQLLCFKILVGLKKYFFLQEGDKYYLLRKGGIRDMAYMILRNSKKPLNIEEIMAIVHKYYYEGSKYHVLNSVIGNIKQDDRIIQFDKYVFGVAIHFAYTKNEWINICEVSKEFLKKEKRQCYITEILEDVRDKYPLIKSKYELVFILRTDMDIKDLGFFNFTLTSFGQQERIKVSDLIRNLFMKDSRVIHVNEIKEKLIATRYVHEMGISSLLKGQDYLKNYAGGYFGLKNMEEENNIQLAGEERFLRYLVNQYFFPHTEINTIAEYFDSEELQRKIISTITTSKLFQVYTFDNEMMCVIVKDWSMIKKTKCLLANLNEEVYEEQLLWMLRDIGVNVCDYKKDLYKMKNDRSISLLNNKYLYKKTETITPELISLLEECYDFINDSTRSYSLSELFELIDPRKTDFDYDQFISAIKEDERFLILDNSQVLIK